ncbi:hypothetical protein BDV93DRAFT_510224 [Ceratobasidium sp. AG-I]|nr:hypothetical protein BDV93DRAFT_510224 [Ceratobasidium sp. AG-I]
MKAQFNYKKCLRKVLPDPPLLQCFPSVWRGLIGLQGFQANICPNRNDDYPESEGIVVWAEKGRWVQLESATTVFDSDLRALRARAHESHFPTRGQTLCATAQEAYGKKDSMVPGRKPHPIFLSNPSTPVLQLPHPKIPSWECLVRDCRRDHDFGAQDSRQCHPGRYYARQD